MLGRNSWLRRSARRVVPAIVREVLWGGWSHMQLQGLRMRPIAAACLAVHRPRTPTLVVFVSDLPRSREAKLAYGLQQAGWRVILLHRESPTFDAGKYFVEVQSYRNPSEALNLAAQHSPIVYHVFANWNFSVAATLMRHKPGKIVFDDYDVMAGMVRDDFAREHYPGQVELERYCLENADGLCCRSLETQYAKRYLGYRFRGKRLLLLDCCWGIQPSTCLKGNGGRNGFQIVYCGNMPSRIDHGEEEPKNDMLKLAKSIVGQGVDLNVYPSFGVWSGDFEAAFSQYLDLGDSTPFFHIHHPVSPDQLVKQMAQYDAGLFDATVFLDDYGKAYTQCKFDYASSNKFFDYIDSGLPIIIRASNEFLLWWLNRIGVTVEVNEELIGCDALWISQIDWAKLRRNVVQARSHYAIGNQVERLVRFYETL